MAAELRPFFFGSTGEIDGQRFGKFSRDGSTT
jgi:hypothetical protein